MTTGLPKTLEAHQPAKSSLITDMPRPVGGALVPVGVEQPQPWRGLATTVVEIGKGTVGTAAALSGFFAGFGGPVAGLAGMFNGQPLAGLGLIAGGLVIAGALFAIAERWAPTALVVISGGAFQPGSGRTTLTVLAGSR